MDVNSLLYDDGSQDYYDPSFRDTLEAHMAYLRGVATTYSVVVTPFHTVVHNQDLFGLLHELRVPACLHWLVMRMNNFFSPYDLDSRCTGLIVPTLKEVDRLRQSWRTTTVITT